MGGKRGGRDQGGSSAAPGNPDRGYSASSRKYGGLPLRGLAGAAMAARPIGNEEVYIRQLSRRAALLDDEFQLCVQGAVERKFGSRVDFHRAPVKTKERMREKLGACAAESADPAMEFPLAALILDPVLSLLVCSGPAEMLEVASWLLEEGRSVGLPVVCVKNKFALDDASEYDGYRDLMMCVFYEGSLGLAIISEIQIHARSLYGLKLQMHKLYKVKRATAMDVI